MIDEHFMRQWNAGHSQFSADFGRKVARLSKLLAAPAGGSSAIRQPYASAPSEAERAQAQMHRAAESLFSALAAIATTFVLFATVGALAIAGSAEAAPARLTMAMTPHSALLL